MERKNETYANTRQELPQDIHIRLPKFQICSDLDMVESTKKLGITNIFESGADFGELGDGPLHVTRMIHTDHSSLSRTLLLIKIEEPDTRYIATKYIMMFAVDVFYMTYTFSASVKL